MSAVAVGVGVSAAGVGLAAAQAAGAFAPNTKPSPYATFGQVVGQALAAPVQYATNAKYNPKYAALNSSIAWQNMFGVAGKNGKPGTPGSLDLAEASQPRLLGLQTQDRAASIADVNNLGASAYQSIYDYNPQAGALITGANDQVQQRLDAHGQLDPWTRMALQQNYRSGEAARGFGGGSADAAMEAYYQTATQEQRQLQNIGLADQQAQANQGYFGDPFQQVLGRTSGGVQVPGVSLTANQPNSFTPDNNLTSQGLAYQQQQQNAAYASQMGAINRLVSPGTASTLGGIAGYFGSLGGGDSTAPYGLGGMAG